MNRLKFINKLSNDEKCETARIVNNTADGAIYTNQFTPDLMTNVLDINKCPSEKLYIAIINHHQIILRLQHRILFSEYKNKQKNKKYLHVDITIILKSIET